jgi:cytochrome c553
MTSAAARRAAAVCAVLAIGGTGGAARAAPDGAAIALHGAGGTPACATCHGAQGQGNPAIGAPRLAGDGATYLRWQLNDFASGHRVNPIMQPIARSLSPAERAAVAAFFAGLPALTPRPAKPGANPLGARLAARGRWALGLPGCTQCHGPGGIGVGASFPHLAGLTAPYIAAQLNAFRQHQRPAGPLGLMWRVAGKLSPADIAAVSAYFAAAGGSADGGSAR